MHILKVWLIIILGIGFIVMFLRMPKEMFYFYILIKPMVDRFAENGTTVFGTYLGYHYIVAVFLPLLALLYIMLLRVSVHSLPFKGIIAGYFLVNILSFLIAGNYSVTTASFYIRVLFPIFLYISIPFIITSREDVLRFLKLTAFSGISPVMMIFLQKLGLIQYNRVADTIGNEIYNRATGGYSDSFAVALPIIVAIVALLFLLQYLKENGESTKIYWVMLFVFLISLFFTYHRMTYICTSMTLVTWILFNKRKGVAIFLALCIMISLPLMINFVSNLYSDFYLLSPSVSEEVTLNNDGEEFEISSRTLDGRWGVWQYYLGEYAKESLLYQVFGIRMVARAPHNDYIRVLMTNGLLGLLVYLTMLTLIGIKIIYLLRSDISRQDSFIRQFLFTALLMFMFYVVSSITLAISLLSTSSWFFWIFIGTAFYQFQMTQNKAEAQDFSDRLLV